MGMAAILFNGAEPFEQIINYLSRESLLWNLVKIAEAVSEKKQKKKQDGGFGGRLGFPIGTILTIFDLEVILLLQCKFQLKSPYGSGGYVKNWFSRWHLWRPSWISNQQNFTYFWSTSHFVATMQVSAQIARWFRSRRQKSIFNMVAVVTILDFHSTRF